MVPTSVADSSRSPNPAWTKSCSGVFKKLYSHDDGNWRGQYVDGRPSGRWVAMFGDWMEQSIEFRASGELEAATYDRAGKKYDILRIEADGSGVWTTASGKLPCSQ